MSENDIAGNENGCWQWKTSSPWASSPLYLLNSVPSSQDSLGSSKRSQGLSALSETDVKLWKSGARYQVVSWDAEYFIPGRQPELLNSKHWISQDTRETSSQPSDIQIGLAIEFSKSKGSRILCCWSKSKWWHRGAPGHVSVIAEGDVWTSSGPSVFRCNGSSELGYFLSTSRDGGWFRGLLGMWQHRFHDHKMKMK